MYVSMWLILVYGGHACICVANIGMRGGMHVSMWLILVWGACMYMCG